MLKIVLCLCWTVILVSGNGNGTSATVPNPTTIPTSVIAKDDSVKIPPEPPAAPTKPPVPIPTTSSTTLAPTPPTTPTTTAKPTTPAPSPDSNKTTTAPTPTPDSNKTTTTVAPITTTVPTTTVAPPPTTPMPPPKTGEWIVNGTNQTCIVVRMAVEFNISYPTNDNKTEFKMLTLPSDENSTVTTGDCGAKEQTITIEWHGNDSMSLHFVMNETNKNYYMHHVEVNLQSNEFSDVKLNSTLKFVHEAKQFATGLTNSYRCMRLQTLNLTTVGTNDTLSLLKISDLQFQAFKTDKAKTFGLAQDCSSDVPDVVPIAVGCALTALVIIVLGAYLVGRRRSQARGYVSM